MQSKPGTKKRQPFKLQSLDQVFTIALALAAMGLLFGAFVPIIALGPLVTDCGCGTVVTRTRAELVAHGGLLAVVSFCIFAMCGCVAWVRWQAKRSVSESALCSRFGVDAATLKRVTEERAIQPRFLIGGVAHYDPREFGDAATLLRGASAALKSDSLLRAARPSAPQPPESLLRAADVDQTPTQ